MLDGIRVVDCSTEIAGPYCTKLLADAGADVIKVEPPGGDPLRSWGSGALFDFLNTSKRSVVDGPGDASPAELGATADVVIDSGQVSLDVAWLRDRNPGLVVASISPFGLDGPWAGWAATEFTLQGWCGSTGGRGLPEGPPLAAGGRIGEWMAGTYAAVAVVAALRAAARSGHGEHIDVGILDCMTLTMNTYTSVFAEFLGWPPLRRPTRMIEIPSIEPTADGYVAFTTNSAQQFADFLVLIGQTDQLKDRELATAIGRFKRRHEMIEMTSQYTTRHTTAAILEEAALLRIPSGPVGNGATVPGFDHFVERKVFVGSPTGRFVQPRVPYRISGVEPRPFGPPPRLGEHTGAADWRSSDRPRVARGHPDAAPALPLDGIRVVDCTAWWAGPAATHALACLGAEVIKVESVSRPDLMRYTSTRRPPEPQWWEWGPLYHGANNSKRGVTLDLTQDAGVDLLRRLLTTADVLLENFTPRVMEQFGLGWDAVHRLNSALTMVRLPAYGLDGPWRERTGFAQTMEAITGMAWVTGCPDGPPLLPRGACDPLAAMHAVFATFLALDERERTGEGRLVEATMIEAALNMAAEQVVEYSACGRLLERAANRGPGAAPQGVYPTAGDEEWLALAIATDGQWAALRAELGDPAWADDPSLSSDAGRRAAHDRLDDELSRWCADRDAPATAERLASIGVPAAVVVDAREVAHNPQLNHRGFFEVEDHPVTGAHRLPMLPFRFRGRPGGWMRGPAPTLGQHNAEILGGLLGLSADELALLRDDHVIGDRPLGV
ncbi:MAG TPA: CoA transferase [Acidimicrobiia bacterium]|nr:CoA transferase [Acidimicrobiia bacterium]